MAYEKYNMIILISIFIIYQINNCYGATYTQPAAIHPG